MMLRLVYLFKVKLSGEHVTRDEIECSAKSSICHKGRHHNQPCNMYFRHGGNRQLLPKDNTTNQNRCANDRGDSGNCDIDANIGKGVFTPNFESEFSMIRRSLLALL